MLRCEVVFVMGQSIHNYGRLSPTVVLPCLPQVEYTVAIGSVLRHHVDHPLNINEY